MKTTKKNIAENGFRYGQGETKFGPVFLVFSGQGLCSLRLLEGKSAGQHLRDLGGEYAQALEDQAGTQKFLKQINQVIAGKLEGTKIPLDMRGTPFQKRVWRELLRVRRGTTCSYSDLARKVGKPQAVRAVASACARNPVGLVVPCHRILRSDGSLGGYYWGLERKREILRHEKVPV